MPRSGQGNRERRRYSVLSLTPPGLRTTATSRRCMPRAPTLCCCHGGGREREHARVWMHVSLHLHTRKPDIWSCCAAVRPAMPAPITTACFCASACAAQPQPTQRSPSRMARHDALGCNARSRAHCAQRIACTAWAHSFDAKRLLRTDSPLCIRASWGACLERRHGRPRQAARADVAVRVQKCVHPPAAEAHRRRVRVPAPRHVSV